MQVRAFSAPPSHKSKAVHFAPQVVKGLAGLAPGLVGAHQRRFKPLERRSAGLAPALQDASQVGRIHLPTRPEASQLAGCGVPTLRITASSTPTPPTTPPKLSLRTVCVRQARSILRNPTRRVNHTKSHAARLARPAFPEMIRNVTLGAPVCLTRRPKSRMAPALSPILVQAVGELLGIMCQLRDIQQHGSCGPLWRPWSIGTGPSTLDP